VFAYPLSKPYSTLYHKLGITPEATAADIRDAKAEKINSLTDARRDLEKKLRKVYEKIPELETVSSKVESLQKQREESGSDELKEALHKLAELETEALKIEAGYREYRKQVEEIDRKINEINNMRLESPEERRKYDEATPPCALLKLSRPRFPLFSDRKVAQYFIRVEVAHFLEKEKKLKCYHPSDFTKKDFTSDFTHNEYLDGKENENEKER